MFGKEKKNKRFIIKEEQSLGFSVIQVIVDTKTGVNYLMTIGSGQNLTTPLLGADGKPLVDRIEI